jgi:hypothetical protein
MQIMKKAVLAGTLGAAALTAATPAMADDWRHRHRGGDTTGAAVAGGIVGLALGAAIASGNRDRYYDDDDYYYRHHRPRPRVYVYESYPRYYGGWDRPRYRPYYRDAYPRGYHYGGGYYARGW